MKKPRAFQPVTDSLESRRLLSRTGASVTIPTPALSPSEIRVAQAEARAERLTALENARTAQQAHMAVNTTPSRLNLGLRVAGVQMSRGLAPGVDPSNLFQRNAVTVPTLVFNTTATRNNGALASGLGTAVAGGAFRTNNRFPVIPSFDTPFGVTSGLVFNNGVGTPFAAFSNPGYGATTGLIFNNGVGASNTPFQSPSAFGVTSGLVFNNGVGVSHSLFQPSSPFGVTSGLIFNNGVGTINPFSTSFVGTNIGVGAANSFVPPVNLGLIGIGSTTSNAGLMTL